MTAPGELARFAVDFAMAIGDIAGRARQPGFTSDAWQELAQGVAIDDFSYIGRDKTALRWPDFLDRIDRWSRVTDFVSVVERVEPGGNLVFLQLDEHSTTAAGSRQLTTMTIFDFDAAGCLRRIDSFS